MFSPRTIFLGLWISQITLHLFLSDDFHSMLSITWWIVGWGIIFFTLGTFFADRFSVQHIGKPSLVTRSYDAEIRKLFHYFIIVYPAIAICALIALYILISGMDVEIKNLRDLREAVVFDFLNYRILNKWFRIFYLGVGFSIFFVAHAKLLTRKQLICVLLVGLLSAILTSGRLYLLLYFLAVSVLLYRSRVISLKGVLVGAIVFIALFLALALLLGKGEGSGVTSLIGRLAWNVEVYFLSSLSCFNEYILTGSPPISGGALIPNVIRWALSEIGIQIPYRPLLNPFLYVPIPCNTYTFLFPLFHDGSFYGVICGSFIIGYFQQILYVQFKSSTLPIWWYLYSISLYAIFMTIFEDPYFSSPGFWFQLLLPPIIFYFYHFLNLNHFGSK